MESIIVGVLGLFSRLAGSCNNFFESVNEVFARQIAAAEKRVEPAVGIILWCVPVAFWAIVIRLVVKH